jgi:hypothetical protein
MFTPGFQGGFRPMPMFRSDSGFRGGMFDPRFRGGMFDRRFDRVEDRLENRSRGGMFDPRFDPRFR